jgi:uncharacterized protein
MDDSAKQSVEIQNDLQHLLIFARLPDAGKAKTRLIPALGPEAAASLYSHLIQTTLDTATKFNLSHPCKVTLCVSASSPQEARQRIQTDFAVSSQHGNTLGERMQHAAAKAFEARAERVVIIGTDCVQLCSTHLEKAFELLDSRDVVIGPAEDGGYYLIGMRRWLPELFDGIQWGTDRVLQQTRRRISEMGCSSASMQTLSDLDFPEDLLGLRCPPFSHLLEPILGGTVGGRLTVVIPTLNESKSLGKTLASIGAGSPDLEIIVVDGGSADETVQIATSLAVRVIVTRPGRARQMNAGAAVATGQYLLFLHADTILPAGFQEVVRATLEGQPQYCAGAFGLSIDHPASAFRWIERAVHFRSRWLGMPYGDQAIFVRAKDFYRLGGFKTIDIMEDFELIRRLKKIGKIRLVASNATTSARRWIHRGILKTTLVNQLCILAYTLGIQPASIARFYRGSRVRPDKPESVTQGCTD